MPSAYETVFKEVMPGERPPRPDHSEEFYCHQQVVKKKGRRKKTDPIRWMIYYVPWEDLNDSELIHLCTFGLPPSSKREMEIWEVLHRGVDRETLIGIICGTVDPTELPSNPFHDRRDALQHFMHSNWKYIWSQITCNTYCWECPDAKVQECVLENYKNLRRSSR